MDPLSEIIRARIRDGGPIGFDEFMEYALYDPEYGYYRRPRNRPRTGREGDFYTSVSVGPLFGRLLARQFLEMWEGLGAPESFSITEQGGEDGQLAGDILAWCRVECPPLYRALSYVLVEEHLPTRDRQREGLEALGFSEKVSWQSLKERAEIPSDGVFFSNELVDAFPVKAIIFQKGEWLERVVSLDAHGDFAWSNRPLTTGTPEAIAALTLPEIEGYKTEVNLRARAWMEEAARSLTRGYLLTIDYGFPAEIYYAPFRNSGTLTGYKNHRRSDDVLHDPGGIDLTAHVDFTALARAGTRAGLVNIGFLDQQRFLTGIGASELGGASKLAAGIREAVSEWQTLTHPHYLGAKFQVLIQARNAPSELIGLAYARTGDVHGIDSR